MRKHEVFAAGVEVEAVTEVLERHRRALDVPAGAAFAKRGLPRGFAGFCSLPESEIADRVLVIFVGGDAGAIFDAFEVLFAELAVACVAGDTEIPTAVFGLVRDVLGGKALDERDHLVDVFSGACDNFGALDAERVHVFKEGLLVGGRCRPRWADQPLWRCG